MTFNILDHLDKLEPDGGTNDPRGDHSYKCPVCGSNNFKVNVKNGYWNTYGCDCASTENGKRKIRNAISPAKDPNDINPIPTAKPKRPTQHRGWEYFDKAGNFLFTVHRWDDHETTSQRFKNGRCIRQTFSPGSTTIVTEHYPARTRYSRELSYCTLHRRSLHRKLTRLGKSFTIRTCAYVRSRSSGHQRMLLSRV